MKNAADMTVDEFRNLLATITAPPDVPPLHPGHYQRKQRPSEAQKPFWSRRKKGKNTRPKPRRASRTCS